MRTFYYSVNNTGGTLVHLNQKTIPSMGYTAEASRRWLPVAGNWNGSSGDGVGVYDPVTSRFFLFNYIQSQSLDTPPDFDFVLGTPNSGSIPIAGDWNGDGTDTVGLYNPTTSVFTLWNENAAGAAPAFTTPYGSPGAGWLPLAGDWDGDGVDTISLYDPDASYFYIINTNAAPSPGYAEIGFGYGAEGSGGVPIAGDFCIYACSNGQDDDSDGYTDTADPGCISLQDMDESNAPVSSLPVAGGPPMESGCGDGIWQAGEECEDGNAVSGDGCSATCTTECMDTDGGNNLLEKGTATYWHCYNPPGAPNCMLRSSFQVDRCASETTLDEWLCDPLTRRTMGFNNVSCPAGKICSDGACINPVSSAQSSVSAVSSVVAPATTTHTIVWEYYRGGNMCWAKNLPVEFGLYKTVGGTTVKVPVHQGACSYEAHRQGTAIITLDDDMGDYKPYVVTQWDCSGGTTEHLGGAPADPEGMGGLYRDRSFLNCNPAYAALNTDSDWQKWYWAADGYAENYIRIGVAGSFASSSLSSSSCESLACPPPAEGCMYDNPVVQDGCMVDCGMLTCGSSSSETSSVDAMSSSETSSLALASSASSVASSAYSVAILSSSSQASYAPSYCGDGYVDAARSEQCEINSDCAAGTVCNLNCICEPGTGGTCGNGIREAKEECERSSPCIDASKTCSNCLCVQGPVCNNGVMERGEMCELNEPCSGGAVCSNCWCVAIPRCGNGVLDVGEQCEDDTQCRTNQVCSTTTCRCMGEISGVCGDSVQDPGEQCELGHPCSDPNQFCNVSNCLCTERPPVVNCGNGMIDAGEDCDVAHPCGEGSACNFATCHCSIVPARCGDGVLDPGEECELDNACPVAGLACDFTECRCVQQETNICGNGVLDPGEQCEVGSACPFGWKCDYPQCICEQQSVCGDGMLDPGEQCETQQPCPGENQSCDFSRCRCAGRIVLCGNGVQDPDEECDDGNTTGEDGCSGACTLEKRTVIAIQTEGGASLCGNGAVEGMEECDDGNTVNGDGCSPACTWEFFGAPPEVQEAAGSSVAFGGSSFGLILEESMDTASSMSAQGGTLIGSLVPIGPLATLPGSTGPAAVAVIAVGAAAGFAWFRRKKRE
ncbi:MAG: DUF4215 domain-containing protein [Candidatus Peribacteraceae bacterium]|nr:DUF4215 domain-containing protein [Candidatus Peribacteraceae bacterium]